MTSTRAMEDRQIHPWPGLAAYGPEDAARYFGREDEVRALAQLIFESVQVTVFGPSGTGKTSMLRAGVLPQLGERDLLAVYIRLDHSPSAPAYATQARQALDAQLSAGGLEVDAACEPTRPDHDESLWEYLHRCEFWSARNRLVRPVLVFDQFEEVFTLGQTARNARDLIAQLGDLCSNSVPRDVETLLSQSGRRLGYPIDTQNYRLVLCLREDFLGRLEEIAESVPALRRNRFGIRAMSGLQALHAVLGPGRDVLDDRVGRQIVATVGNSPCTGDQRCGDEELRPLSVEPALLSLFCRELNTRRLSRGAARIALEDVSQSGSDILQSFYAGAMAGVTPETRAFVEDRLLTTSGFRSAVAVEDVTALGVPVSEIQSLVDQRILRFDERQGVRWVEFTHDILTGVARESRQRRLQEQRESGIRQQARRRTRQVASIAIGATLIVAAVLGSWGWEYHRGHQELASYYNNWVRRYGLPEGVGELTEEQVRHRAVSFKLIRYGSANPVTRVVAVDSQDNPTPKHRLSTYLHEGDDISSSARECQWEYILDSNSKHPVYEKATDRAGLLVWGLIYSPVRIDNKVRASFVGRDGFPQAQAQNGSMAEYVEIEYGTDGFERQLTYMDRQGRPMPGPDRAYGKLQKFDGRGLEVYIASLGPPDKTGNRQKIIDDKGNCVQEIHYDAMGNVCKTRLLDVLDRPTYLVEGRAGSESEYDRFGRMTRRQFFDVNLQPCHDRDGVAGYSLTYDDRGNQNEVRCLGADGMPCRNKDNYYGWSADFDDRGNWTRNTYLGSDGKPCTLKDGYAVVRSKYDQRGNRVEWACFDTHDRPVAQKSTGYHKYAQVYDEGGKVVEERYFDVDGKSCTRTEGYAIVRRKYDERGNKVEWACFDAQDRPTVHKTDGIFKTVTTYDGRGMAIEERYFGVGGKPCKFRYGYATVRMKYDERGNPIEAANFDSEDRPTVDTNGSHKIVGAYNDLGKLIDARFFGTDGKPCAVAEGNAAIRKTYDERSNIIEVEYIGMDGNPCTLKDGYAITRMKYDQWGNQIEWACFDTQGLPTVNASDGTGKTVKAYDQWGNVTEERYFGADDKPRALKDGYAAFRAKYDERGNQVEWANFDTHDRPTINKSDGIHKTQKAYDEQGSVIETSYFGIDGKPCELKDGYATVRMKYDDRGNEVERAFFDSRDQPIVDKSDGSHIRRRSYNNKGKVIEEKYFGADGNPSRQPSGSYGWSADFDERGYQTRWTTLGYDGKPIALNDGYATVRMKYDERGNQIEWACFDVRDQPTVDKSDGTHKVAKSFDQRGKVIETRYFDVDGKASNYKDGYAIVRIRYDEQGNWLESAYFDTQDRPIPRPSSR